MPSITTNHSITYTNVAMKLPYKVKFFKCISCFEFMQVLYFVLKKTLFKEVHVIISAKHLSFV